MEPFIFRQGAGPLLVSMPHVGLHIPDDIAADMTPLARTVSDTDWHIDRLYDFLDDLGASAIAATHSRYVVDLNRSPDGASLYPGQATTGLCPAGTFDDEPLYRDGAAPGQAEIERRVARYWKPYHDKLEAELARLKAAHGYALLWDAHSIRSVVPRLFEGPLPDLNIGTANGASCDPDMARRVLQAAESAQGYSAVLNGRFKGGYITRRYGQPDDDIHAIQLELSQRTYMEESSPFTFREELAEGVRPVIKSMLTAMLDWASTR
ncbi:MAG: N-formylglutamate deformylase [Proteobacteria bacterium]|nr:N-formylglutamate deformylase [Pseudomonadota bacterium]